MKDKLVMLKLPEQLHTQLKIWSATSGDSMNAILVDVLQKFFKVDDFKSRDILKKTSRDIFIPEEIELVASEEESSFSAKFNEIMLKGQHSSVYNQFSLEGF